MVITSVMITSLLVSLAKKGLEKAVESSSEKISTNAVKWIKSLFYKDNKPKKIMQDLIDNPDSIGAQNNAKLIVDNALEDYPEHQKYLDELVSKVNHNEIDISNSKNVNVGNVNTEGGNFRIGDDYGK